MPENLTPTPTDPEPSAPETPPAGATPAPATPPSEPADEPLREPGKKALEAERTARAKAEADLAALRKQIEDASKTAEQKAADDLKAAQAEAAANAAKALRYEIAAEAGIPLALAPRLTGSTREEILADAEQLKTLIPAGATPPGPRSPAPDPAQGARPPQDKTEDDQLYESLFGAQTTRK